MTSNHDFKRLVRERMVRTGETYTAARAALAAQPPPTGTTPSYDAARREQERLVGRLLEGGRLAQVPAKRRTRAAVLLELLTLFRPGTVYTEVEVNDLLREVHEDVAYLRRELVNYHYLERAGGRYRVVDEAPTRAPSQQQEIPAWEAVWLPGFLAGRDSASVMAWGATR